MRKTITAASGHTLFIKDIDRSELPEGLDGAGEYERFYVVKNWDDSGVVFFYLGKGHKQAPRQIVAWYPGGKFWASYGNNFQEAIDGAQRDGWMYA